MPYSLMQMIVVVETYIREKYYEDCRRKSRSFPCVSFPSILSMSESRRMSFPATIATCSGLCTSISNRVYYVRKCRVVKIAISVFGFQVNCLYRQF